MRIKKVILKEFKRFDDLTIDLGENSKKIIALIGPNGCGKSSIFDAFEEILKRYRNYGEENNEFYSKAIFYFDETKKRIGYNRNQAVQIVADNQEITRKSFYIRTSYRFTPRINVQEIRTQPDIFNLRDEPISSISLDQRLIANYNRLLSLSYSEFYKGEKTGKFVHEELTGKINSILSNILDIEISDLGNIIENKGQFYFKKENAVNFPYANLSSGEKEVVDIIVDLIVKTKEFNDTVFCIDEPDLHLHTAIQRKLLIEIDKLIPDTCQLWIATHSIGFIRALQEELKEKSQILDFSKKDYFTGAHTIVPTKTTRSNWQRIFYTALEDLAGLISPKIIIYCEGKDRPGSDGEEKGFDAIIFNNIFSEKYHDILFISSGGNTELDQRSEIGIAILTKVFKDIEIWVLKDRDISSGKLNDENDRQVYLSNNPKHHRVLKRFEIENYLFDKEILNKYCNENNLTFNEEEYDKHVIDIYNQNIKDDIGRIKNYCGISTSITSENFKINLSKLITEDTNVYKELEECIFERK